jgi:hypothetical protein
MRTFDILYRNGVFVWAFFIGAMFYVKQKYDAGTAKKINRMILLVILFWGVCVSVFLLFVK